MPWSAAILAGGHARRLGGRNKSVLDIGGVPLLDRQLAVLGALTDAVVLVGGPSPHPHAPQLEVLPDRWPGTGALGGLCTALTAAPGERVLVLACDMPFLTARFLDVLVRHDPAALAVIPERAGRWHPLCAVYHRRAADRLVEALARGERRVIDVVAGLSPRLLTDDAIAPFDADGRLLANINTPDDYARASERRRIRSAANRTARF